MSQVIGVLQICLVAAACGWCAERMLGSERHGWFTPVFSGIVGIYLGPKLVSLIGWSWGPSVADHLVAPIFAGALIACFFVKLLAVGFAATGR